MKAGDIVEFKPGLLGREWGTTGLITKIIITPAGTGQIYLFANGMSCSIPYTKRDMYIKKVLSDGKKSE